MNLRFEANVETLRQIAAMGVRLEGIPLTIEIGLRLGISDNTMRFHVTSIYHRLGANGRAGAVRIAVRPGLVDR